MTDPKTALTEALLVTAEAASKCLIVGKDKPRIKEATTELRQLLALWAEHNKAATETIRTLLAVAREWCDHAGAQRGYNERDGSWMNPCPTCGHSE